MKNPLSLGGRSRRLPEGPRPDNGGGRNGRPRRLRSQRGEVSAMVSIGTLAISPRHGQEPPPRPRIHAPGRGEARL